MKIQEEQSAFLQGRNMLDSIVVTNEVIHDARTKKKQTFLFKVDSEKAYDSVSWSFLFMLRRLNFCERWVQWIKSCLKSSRVSVLVNGSPTDEFGMEKGLRQGNPIAPLLFLVVVEGLNGLVKQVLRLRKYSGYSLGKS